MEFELNRFLTGPLPLDLFRWLMALVLTYPVELCRLLLCAWSVALALTDLEELFRLLLCAWSLAMPLAGNAAPVGTDIDIGCYCRCDIGRAAIGPLAAVAGGERWSQPNADIPN